MKKLTGLLAAVLVFAFSATSALAATYTDAADQANVAVDAAAKLTALGITEGYEDGSFGFENTITRAEFAKMAVIASGAESTATMLEGSKPSFKDVKAGAWYTGWINAAESLNLVQGDGNGTFRPNDTISNQEVITVLMRMLGYNDNLPGAWPTNYVTEANKKDVLDDVTIVAAAAAKRGDVAVMVGNALDTELVTYDKDTDEFVLKQTTKSDSAYVTLLADAFKGTYAEVESFAAVTDVRDAAKGTLDWNVTATDKELSGNYIIDAETRVSVNGGNLFDLEGHQGNVYYVVENGKKYARFIEVESSKVLTSDKPVEKDGKVAVNNTKYNAVKDKDDNVDVKNLADLGEKNSKYALYLNDDDQVYAVASDMDDANDAYFVKSISTSTIKLVGNTSTTIDNDDDDIMIWNGTEFVTPSALKVGDALIEITADELYVLAEAKTGVLKGKTTATDADDNKVLKYNIGGTNYVVDRDEDAVKFNKFLDGEFNDAGVDEGDVFGNEVTYLLNDDNTIAAILVDEVSTGTKLYGVVTGGDTDKGTSWGTKDNKKVTIFTSEGTTVEYDVDEDEVTDLNDDAAAKYFGQLVEYKLNKDGEIEKLDVVATTENDNFGTLTGEVEIKNNAYLTDKTTSLTLTSNVAIFEITNDGDDIEVNLVTRAAMLAGDDFTPGDVGDEEDGLAALDGKDLTKYCAYVTNSSGVVKAMAYTDANSTTLYYDLVEGAIADDDNDYTLTIGGVDYDSDATKDLTDDLIIYTKKSGDIQVEKTYADKSAIEGIEVDSYVDGLIVLTEEMVPEYYDGKANEKKEVADGDQPTTPVPGENADGQVVKKNIMTDANTVVYVMGSNGKYTEGTLDDISSGDMVYVPVIDGDDYADLVIVDQYLVK